MAKKNNTKVAGGNGSVVVDGMADAMRKADLAKEIAELERASKRTASAEARAARDLERRVRKLECLASGEAHPEFNPKGRHNPQIQPETLRASEPGELVNGKPAKGWVVEIACAECGTSRLVNLQDAFQVRYCEEHKNLGRKQRAAVRKYDNLSVEELEAKLAALRGEPVETTEVAAA